MRTTTLSTRLTAAELALLDNLAAVSGQGRAAMIKSILRTGMAELRFRNAVDAYRLGHVTLSKAAELAGLSLWDMVARLDKAQAEFHYDAEELREDLAAFAAEPTS